MKTRVGTALSLVGVLAAGSLAALVNSQVLDTTSNRSVRASSTDPWGPSATQLDDSSSTTPKKSTEARLVKGSRRPGDPQVYAVGSAGTVTVTLRNGKLRLNNATPVGGWKVVSAEATGPTQVRVIFRGASTQVTFTAAVAGDKVVTVVSVDQPTSSTRPVIVTGTTTTTSTTTAPTSTTRPPRSTTTAAPTTTSTTTTVPTTDPPPTDPPTTTTTEPPVTDPPPATDPPPPPS